MKLFRKRATPVILVGNEEVHFVLQAGSAQGKILDPIPLRRLLADEADWSAVPEAFRHQANSTMVVPDYWIASASFPFQSRKGSLAEAFLERKIQAELSDVPETKDFFEYFFHESERGENEVTAYFLREPRFFQAYERLALRNLHPRWITTPAFLWEAQLKERIPGFQQGGKAFVHILPQACFLYFFYEGHFLFSREIALPEYRQDSSEQVETLTYEIHQSLYLFSQKAKAEIDRVYAACFGYLEPRVLSERLGMQVEEVAALEEQLTEGSSTIGQPGLLSGLCLPDLSRSPRFLRISNRQREREQKWKPVQKVGIAVGTMLLLLLAGEGVLLWNWSMPVRAETAGGSGVEARETVAALRQYNDALDLFLKEKQRPSAAKAIIDVARSLPEEVWLTEIVVETEPKPGVTMTGAVRAEKPNQFREALCEFLDGLKGRFQGARSLGLQDIDVDTGKCRPVEGGHSCAIALEFGLP
jgi:hypothetical protein